MNCTLLAKPIGVLVLSCTITILFIFLQSETNPNIKSSSLPNNTSNYTMATRSFILWLHGLGDSGPANEPIKTLFTSSQFKNTKWSFPSAPSSPVTCNCKYMSLSLFVCLLCFQFWVFVFELYCWLLSLIKCIGITCFLMNLIWALVVKDEIFLGISVMKNKIRECYFRENY